MSEIRPVFIVNRFWPLFDGSERTLADLAVELHARGVQCTILAARCHASWPKCINFHGIPLHRTVAPPPLVDSFKGRLTTANYVRTIARWLRHNRGAYNLVFAAALKHEAYAAMAAFGRSKSRPPIVLRAERPGREGDCVWQLDAPGGRRMKRRMLKADAFVAPSRQIEQELIAAGYARERIHYLPHAVRCAADSAAIVKSERQRRAREALAAAGPAFGLPSWATVAVFTGRLVKQNRLTEVIDAWPAIVARRPNARLWIVGDGPERVMLEARVQDRHLMGRVVLTGAFDNVGDLLDAADVFVNPAPLEDLSVAVLEAMAAGLPVVAPDNPSNRALVGHGVRGLLYGQNGAGVHGEAAGAGGQFASCGDPGEAVARLFDYPELAICLGEAGRKLAAERFDFADCVESYTTLFGEMMGVGG